jgi:integrase/recombinase XerD
MRTPQQAVVDYLSLRRSLGFKLEKHEVCLREFVSFLKKRGTSRITTKLALQFATRHRGQQPAEWASRLSIVRGFACYRSGADPATEIPPHGMLPNRPLRARPYLYSEDEIGRLLTAAGNLSSSICSLRPRTYYCLLGLLVVTGMRLGEVMNLQLQDVDWSEGLLTIRNTKFGKSRLIPLHPSTQKILAEYAKHRDRFFAGRPVQHFFVSSRGNRLDKGDIHRTFYVLSRQIGLRAPSDSRGPRLHDFRHRFAVETLLRWYRCGEEPERRLPVLSTYLGHSHVTDTYWYLTNTPELMTAAGKLLEKRWKGVI